jgi:hypothetical protein
MRQELFVPNDRLTPNRRTNALRSYTHYPKKANFNRLEAEQAGGGGCANDASGRDGARLPTKSRGGSREARRPSQGVAVSYRNDTSFTEKLVGCLLLVVARKRIVTVLPRQLAKEKVFIEYTPAAPLLRLLKVPRSEATPASTTSTEMMSVAEALESFEVTLSQKREGGCRSRGDRHGLRHGVVRPIAIAEEGVGRSRMRVRAARQ